ncbi:type I-E CRISPR-associated protein Cse2/CasB [Streptomyces sp. CC210A]|uniref:type I-E CRISPR-associated protein Cse2/CasB n=1 Tax=Streptomyces sp. CC210A TaxID=2898184 RepID=UPI001F19ACF0|nr:type I-E CRISPR-associated protein Cse2/CasB [Streptomyces sp. CC210A]
MTAASPPALRDRLGIVGQLADARITVLQKGYLNDEGAAVATLARLRTAAGKDALAIPQLWGLVDTAPLYEKPEDSDARPLREHELQWAEQAFHTALGLWAVHQQSRRTGMHQGTRAPSGQLGAAVRRLMPTHEITEPVHKRFVRAGTAPNWPRLGQRLRDLVVLLRQHDVPLDYGLLAEQLYTWQQPGGPHTVRAAWGRSFHAYRPADPAGAETGTTSDTTRSSDTDKDAS